MRRFLVGLLAVVGALVLLLAGGVAAAFWLLWPTAPELPERIVLMLDVREPFDEVPAADPLSAVGLRQKLTVDEAILALDHAGRDPRVRGVLARLTGETPGFAQAQELRAAIARLREQGRFALAYADAFGEFGEGNRGYYLASAFEEIHLQPMGAVGLTGIMIETPLLRGLLEKLGIEPVGDRRGAYKSAFETFTERELSETHREQLESLADSIDAQIKRGIAEARGLDAASVDRLIDSGPHLAEEAMSRGLVDGLSYWDQVVDRAKSRAGADSDLVDLADYVSFVPAPPDDAPVIALVHGIGQIQRGENDRGATSGWVMGADSVARALDAASDDPDVKAILFRVDSPGGSVVASETIGREVRRAIERGKPVIVSMAETAASGGYWISMDATRIVAAPGTLTGSIGVFAGKPVLSELSQEVGVSWGRVQRGANADMWSVLDGFDDHARARLDAFLDHVYEAFTEGVARGRGLPAAKVMEVAEGRVWTGAQAREVGLVDELGGFARALEVAKETAGIEADQPVELRRFPEPTPPWEQVLDLLGGGSPLGLEAFARRIGLLWPGALSAPPIAIR
jgi:protease IV